MISDKNSAYCCCIAALATLKGKYPVRIKAPDGTFCDITYEEKEDARLCSCGDYFAYAAFDEKDFSLHFKGISPEFTSENDGFLKSLFESAAKILDGVCGAQLYLHTKGDLNEKIFAT